MTIVVVASKVTPSDIVKASEEYGPYIKVTADINLGLIAIGGEWHADAEKVLLEKGAKQENIWGGGIDSSNGTIDYNSLINIRPGVNESMEIIDKKIRAKFGILVKKSFGITK